MWDDHFPYSDFDLGTYTEHIQLAVFLKRFEKLTSFDILLALSDLSPSMEGEIYGSVRVKVKDLGQILDAGDGRERRVAQVINASGSDGDREGLFSGAS